MSGGIGASPQGLAGIAGGPGCGSAVLSYDAAHSRNSDKKTGRLRMAATDGNGSAEQQFDEEVDVVVVGYGFAGGVSAIEAHDAGAKVLVVEKMPDPGGISICSHGAIC